MQILKIPQFLKEIHAVIPGCQVIPTIHCGIDPESLWVAANTDSSDHHHSHQEHDNHTVDASSYVTFSFRDSKIVDETRFKKFIRNLPWEVFRIKGPVRFADRVVMLNFVGGKGEWIPWDEEPETRLAFIGWVSDGMLTRKRFSKRRPFVFAIYNLFTVAAIIEKIPSTNLISCSLQ